MSLSYGSNDMAHIIRTMISNSEPKILIAIPIPDPLLPEPQKIRPFLPGKFDTINNVNNIFQHDYNAPLQVLLVNDVPDFWDFFDFFWPEPNIVTQSLTEK